MELLVYCDKLSPMDEIICIFILEILTVSCHSIDLKHLWITQ